MRACRTSIAALVLGACLAIAPALMTPAFAAYTCDGTHPNDEFRWAIKSLSDPDRRQIDFDAIHTTVARMRAFERPDLRVRPDTARISPEEMQTYLVRARVLRAKREPDGDIILVVSPPVHRRQTIVFEFGNPRCVTSQFRRAQIGEARRAVLADCGRLDTDFTALRGRVRVRGVGFWDRRSSEPFSAPNQFQLWPVLGIHGTCSQV